MRPLDRFHFDDSAQLARALRGAEVGWEMSDQPLCQGVAQFPRLLSDRMLKNPCNQFLCLDRRKLIGRHHVDSRNSEHHADGQHTRSCCHAVLWYLEFLGRIRLREFSLRVSTQCVGLTIFSRMQE